ncbi:MAG: hypothetical protein WDN03_09920 [Rhizomicrobium sp.]
MAEVAAERRQDDLAGLDDSVRRDRARHLRQRHMDGQRHHAQRVARQHHHRARRAGQRLQEFGMSGIGKAGRGEHRLVDRRGHDRGGLAGHRLCHGQFDGLDHGVGVVAVGPAWRARRRGFDADERAVEALENLGRADDLQLPPVHLSAERPAGRDRHLRPDAGRLAHGDQDRRAI